MRLDIGFSLFILMTASPAYAGAWLPDKTTGKLIVTHIEHKQREDNIVSFRHGEIYRSLLLEYGLSDSFALSAKRGQQARKQPSGKIQTNDTRIGVMMDTPKLATGRLPPFTYRLAKSALPREKLKREKRASLTLSLQDDIDVYAATLSLGDKVKIGRFNLTQEVEMDRVSGNKRDTRGWLYRFKLGYHGFQIGSETTRFIDYRSHYAALTHSTFAQWSPHGRNWQFRLKNGTSRAPLGNFGVQRNDYTTIEMQLNFRFGF